MKDFYDDSGALFVRLFHNKDDFPSIIKNAELFVDRESMAELPETSFAARNERMFPVYDPASTLLSYAYAKAAEEEVPAPVLENIKVAIGLFGLEQEILRLESVIAERKRAEMARKANQKKAEAAPDERWEVRISDGAVEIAADGTGKEAFLKVCQDLAAPDTVKVSRIPAVKKFAECLVNEALRLGGDFYFELPDDVLKLAGHGYPDPELLQAYVSARSLVLPLDQRAAFVEKVAKLRTAHPTLDGVAKLAEMLDSFDSENGLVKYYGDKFPDPLRSVHNISTREAARLTQKVAIGDVEYRVSYTDKEKAKKVAHHVLGSERYHRIFEEEGFTLTKLAKVLSDDHASAFNRLMAAP